MDTPRPYIHYTVTTRLDIAPRDDPNEANHVPTASPPCHQEAETFTTILEFT